MVVVIMTYPGKRSIRERSNTRSCTRKGEGSGGFARSLLNLYKNNPKKKHEEIMKEIEGDLKFEKIKTFSCNHRGSSRSSRSRKA